MKSVVIDPGHGGADPGAVNGNIKEKDFNLAVSKYMYDRFRQLGIPVKMTRTTDETLDRNERINRILTAFGNNPDTIVLSNHVNAGGGEGAEVAYALRNKDTLSKNVLNSIGSTGQKTRSNYQRRLPEDPTKDYYFIHRLTGQTEPLLVEYGFIDNPNDLFKLQKNITTYGEAVVKAVADYAGVPYTPPVGGTVPSGDTYTVQRGDSLYSIANKYKTTVDKLRQANNLVSDLLGVGQVLIIPGETVVTPSGEYTVYTVKSGDTLYNIAANNGISVNDLIKYNNLPSTVLSIGQQLRLPGVSNGTQTPIEPSQTTYVVVPGDSLWKIANDNNVSVDDIIALNNLKSTLLHIGDKLLLPVSGTAAEPSSYVNYKVNTGDSLYSIAKKYNTTVAEIKRLNNLTSNLLSIGQILNVPHMQNI